MDYHPYNIRVKADGTALVIDWKNAVISDYRLDLAWTMLLTSTYGNPESGKSVLGEYERAAGHSVGQMAYLGDRVRETAVQYLGLTWCRSRQIGHASRRRGDHKECGPY